MRRLDNHWGTLWQRLLFGRWHELLDHLANLFLRICHRRNNDCATTDALLRLEQVALDVPQSDD